MRIETKDPKAPLEVIPAGIEFKNLLTAIDSVTVSVSVKKGVDANPAALLFGSAQITGTDVRQLIQGGLDGVIYLIRFDAVIGDEKYSEAFYLPVEELS